MSNMLAAAMRGECERRRAVAVRSCLLRCAAAGSLLCLRRKSASIARKSVHSVCSSASPCRPVAGSRWSRVSRPSRCGSRRLGQRRPDHKPPDARLPSRVLLTRRERKQRTQAATMRSASTSAIAGRSPPNDGAAPDLAIAGCSAARWGWGSNGSGCLGIGHQNDLHTPTLCCPSGARKVTEVADQAVPSRAAASESASAVPAIVAPSPAGCVRFTRISCGGCHTLAIDGQTWAHSDAQQCTALLKDTRSQTRPLTPMPLWLLFLWLNACAQSSAWCGAGARTPGAS